MQHGWSGIGDVRRREQIREALVLRLADVGQADALRSRRGARVEVHRHVVTLRNLMAEAVRDRDALFHRHAGERNERHDVHRSEARMLARVRAHVDLAIRRGDEGMRGGRDRFGVAGEREHRAVVIAVARLVEKPNAGDLADGLRQPVDHIAAPALADIRHAFDQPRHDVKA